jgi:hypothetical protein
MNIGYLFIIKTSASKITNQSYVLFSSVCSGLSSVWLSEAYEGGGVSSPQTGMWIF